MATYKEVFALRICIYGSGSGCCSGTRSIRALSPFSFGAISQQRSPFRSFAITLSSSPFFDCAGMRTTLRYYTRPVAFCQQAKARA